MQRVELRAAVLLAVAVAIAAAGHGLSAQAPVSPSSPRIAALDSVFLEELTTPEVRDAMREGKTTAIVPSGGLDQNGPYLAIGKHNIILRATTERIARKLGNALVAPIVAIASDDYDPPQAFNYPGWITVRKETYIQLLADIADSLRRQGFQEIILLGDSWGNQEGMQEVADRLAAEWRAQNSGIHYIPEYYDNPRWNRWLEARGIHEVDEGLHDDVRHSSIMMLVDPVTVRMPQRLKAHNFSINGVELAPAEKTIALAEELADYQATVTVAAIRESIAARHSGASSHR